MRGRIPNLVSTGFEAENIDIENIFLTRLHEQIIFTLQKECLRKQTAKSVNKQLGFNASVCDIYVESYHFGCKNKKKNASKGQRGSDFQCKKLTKKSQA